MKLSLNPLLPWVSVVLLSASTVMLSYLVVGKKPDDVYELLKSGKVIVDAPDRWTGSQDEQWKDDFFRLNPDLIRPTD